MSIKIPPVSRMDPIRASTQNLIIDAVNRFNAMSIVPPGGSQTFKNHAQGIILPARMDSDATDKQYASGDVVVITDYMDSLDGTVIGGVSRNYGVFVAKKLAGTQVGRGVAIVVDPIGEKSTGSVCVSGACLAKVNRVSTSPVPGEGYTQVTGSITPGETFLSIGKGTGDVDIIWEENEDVEEHWAYVILPCGSQSGIPAINKSGAIIPPNSAMEVQARDAEGLLEMIKPTEDSLNQVYLSPAYPIPVNTKFYAIKPEDGEVALGSTPTSIGDEMGTVASSWEMAPNKTGFLYLGESGGLAYLRPFRLRQPYFINRVAVLGGDAGSNIKGYYRKLLTGYIVIDPLPSVLIFSDIFVDDLAAISYSEITTVISDSARTYSLSAGAGAIIKMTSGSIDPAPTWDGEYYHLNVTLGAKNYDVEMNGHRSATQMNALATGAGMNTITNGEYTIAELITLGVLAPGTKAGDNITLFWGVIPVGGGGMLFSINAKP
jgi:hypothetical protein